MVKFVAEILNFLHRIKFKKFEILWAETQQVYFF
jgi:hypothetical protein